MGGLTMLHVSVGVVIATLVAALVTSSILFTLVPNETNEVIVTTDPNNAAAGNADGDSSETTSDQSQNVTHLVTSTDLTGISSAHANVFTAEGGLSDLAASSSAGVMYTFRVPSNVAVTILSWHDCVHPATYPSAVAVQTSPDGVQWTTVAEASLAYSRDAPHQLTFSPALRADHIALRCQSVNDGYVFCIRNVMFFGQTLDA